MKYFDTNKKQTVKKQKVEELKAVDMIKPIETGMNKNPTGEKSKKKTIKALYK